MKSTLTIKNNCQAGLIGRFSFPHVFEKYSAVAGAEPKYSISLLISKTDVETKKVIDQAIGNAIEKGIKNKWGGKRPNNLVLPLKDGDEKYLKDEDGNETDIVDENYAGSWYLNAKSGSAVEVYDQSKGPRVKIDKDDDGLIIYGGAYGALDVIFAPYDAAGKRGVTIYLSRVLKTSDGEPFGNRASVEEVFGLSEGDDDFLD